MVLEGDEREVEETATEHEERGVEVEDIRRVNYRGKHQVY